MKATLKISGKEETRLEQFRVMVMVMVMMAMQERDAAIGWRRPIKNNTLAQTYFGSTFDKSVHGETLNCRDDVEFV